MKASKLAIFIALVLVLIPSVALAATQYTPGEEGTIYAQVLSSNGTPVNNATVTLTLYDSAGDKELDGVSMSYIAGSQGLYGYNFTAPSEPGAYVAEVVTANPTGYGSSEIHVVEEVGGNTSCSVNATTIWGEGSIGYTDTRTFGGLLNDIFGGGNMTLPQIFLVLGFMGFALWKKGWVRIILSSCIIIWGAFAMSYDIKIAAPLIAVGAVLFIQAILKQIQQAREQVEE